MILSHQKDTTTPKKKIHEQFLFHDRIQNIEIPYFYYIIVFHFQRKRSIEVVSKMKLIQIQ